MALHKNLIDGEWTDGEPVPNINPSNVKEVVGEYARATAEDAARAIAAAKAAFPAWSRSGPLERHDVLRKAADEILARKEELGRLLAREEGKSLPESIGETVRAAQIFDFFAGECLRLTGETVPSVRPGVGVEMTREAVGVVGLITPWNFPIAIPAWKLAPALAYGNTVVLKPADLVPGCAWAIVDILHRAGLPKGVLNLVMGKGSVVGQAILDSPDVSAISFTGSQATGTRVAEASVRVMRRFQLEMGGKNPLVVLDDADLGVAVECAVNGAFFSTGQRCTASSRLIVTEGIHDRFVAAVAERLKGLKVGRSAEGGHPDRPGGRRGPAEAGRGLYRHRRKARAPSSSPAASGWSATTEGFFLVAGALRRGDERDADQPRGDLRAGGGRDPGQGLRRGAGGGERHALRPVVGHLHHLAQARDPLQAQRRGGHGDGEPGDGGRRLPRALRRAQGVELRPARAGALRGGVLHHRQDRLHRWPDGGRAASASGSAAGSSSPGAGPSFPRASPQREELAYASRHLTSIEINGTYYGSQKPASFRKWHDETPDDFVFAVKGPRFATNRKVLAEAGDVDRALLLQRRHGAQGQARAGQLAVHGLEEVRAGRFRRLPRAAAEGGRGAARSATPSRSATRASARRTSWRWRASTGWR